MEAEALTCIVLNAFFESLPIHSFCNYSIYASYFNHVHIHSILTIIVSPPSANV